jgi:hypothetical protein
VPSANVLREPSPAYETDQPWVAAALISAASAGTLAADPFGDPAPDDNAFRYAASMHRSMQANVDTAHDAAYLEAAGVCIDDLSDNVYGNPNNQTSAALQMIAAAARRVKPNRHALDKVAGPLSDMRSFPQRIALPLRKEMEEIKEQQYLDAQIIYETGRLMRDLEAGDV